MPAGGRSRLREDRARRAGADGSAHIDGRAHGPAHPGSAPARFGGAITHRGAHCAPDGGTYAGARREPDGGAHGHTKPCADLFSEAYRGTDACAHARSYAGTGSGARPGRGL